MVQKPPLAEVLQEIDSLKPGAADRYIFRFKEWDRLRIYFNCLITISISFGIFPIIYEIRNQIVGALAGETSKNLAGFVITILGTLALSGLKHMGLNEFDTHLREILGSLKKVRQWQEEGPPG